MRPFVIALRSTVSLALFALFGAGAILLSPLMFVLRRPEACQKAVRTTWIPLVWLFRLTRLIRVDHWCLEPMSGTVIAANHPSLIDVVLVLTLVPKTLFVAKHALKGNPFISAIVRHTSLPDDERLPDAAAEHLANGWNVVVFPEGTRSPAAGGLGPFRRGAAHIALKAGAPLVALGIVQTPRRILGKHQWAWQMGDCPVVYSFRADEPTRERVSEGETVRNAAHRVTGALRDRILRLVEQVSP